MLDIKFIRENPGAVEKNLKRRGLARMILELKNLLKNDEEYRKILAEMERLRAERNIITGKISEARRTGKPAEHLMEQAKKIPDVLNDMETRVTQLKESIRMALMQLPNMLHESVPEGPDANHNVVVRTFGKQPEFSFEPKSHLEILEGLGLINRERAEKVSGRGFFFVQGPLVLLDYALLRYAMDFLADKGFTAIEPPYMINRRSFEGVTDLETIKDQIYKIDNEDLHLIGTSEHVLGSMFMDEVLLADSMPVKFCGVSPCFRKEVGAHGKYTKGLFRMHQFNKIEQFVFCQPEDSWKFHEELQKNSEELYQNLGIHHRVLLLCSGDTGVVSAKTFDIEAWMADGIFREVGSNSNCLDYQSRRLNIRYRPGEGKPPVGFVHTLNNTAIATSRAMVAIIEQFQNSDGTVSIPPALQKYTGFKKLEKME